MRLVLSTFMSLDGVVQAPGGPDEDTDGGFAHGGWSMPFFDVASMGSAMDAVLAGADALLLGRRTWQSMAAAWPERAGDPFADRMNRIPRYVVSHTLQPDDLTWSNSTLPPADTIGAVEGLRRQPGRDLVVMGSSRLAQLLIRHDVVDEFRLMIEPVLLGGGKKLFPDDGKMRTLELVSTTTSSTGVQIAIYRTLRGT
ncbi:MAG TPA: dihydrofolate reductase family protein [Acidimicrobiia bacterium]|jgi:dihydrofolate reductase|nr:dihydrofolate reductase family protein [Acidimicrobiia bacterium]